MALNFLTYFLPLVGFYTSTGVLAAIGPVADLRIVNKNIAPDGFTRPAVLAGGTFPGPLIKGKKVRLLTSQSLLIFKSFQGDNFQLSVFNELTNVEMLTDTSIVRQLLLNMISGSQRATYSTGMECFKRAQTGRMDLRSSRNVLSRAEIRLTMTLVCLTKLVSRFNDSVVCIQFQTLSSS